VRADLAFSGFGGVSRQKISALALPFTHNNHWT
jgi:hypothetical protein